MATSSSAATSSQQLQCIQEASFPATAQIEEWVDRICCNGQLRLPGSEVHKGAVQWLENELNDIDGLDVSSSAYDLRLWEPAKGKTLATCSTLAIAGEEIPIASTIAYSASTSVTAPMVYIPSGVPLTAENAGGKIVVRDTTFPTVWPYGLISLVSHMTTRDLPYFSRYKRPATEDQLLRDMRQGSLCGVKGYIDILDVPREHMKAHFTPHAGTHYTLPGIFVGCDEGSKVRKAAQGGHEATITVRADVSQTTTKNLHARLPGKSSETIMFVTHTDGCTHVQENGPAALLALAKYFASIPLAQRTRTITFSFNSGHLNLAAEGSNLQSREIGEELGDEITLVVPVEHLGPREIEQYSRGFFTQGWGLKYTGKGEMMVWAAGPMPKVIQAIKDVVKRRKLDRVVVNRGACLPQTTVVPTYTSFGGLGSYYHTRLLPTTSIISGPWSLWSPSWGAEAVDYARMRSQTLALGDLYFALQNVEREEIIASYREYRDTVKQGRKKQFQLFVPSENPE